MTLAQARAQGIAPKSGGTLTTFITPEPPILINAINFQSPTIIVGSKIYQGLLKYTFDLKPLPQLAKSWDVSPDGVVYTFHLQDNVKWHDGQDFHSRRRDLLADEVSHDNVAAGPLGAEEGNGGAGT